MTANERNPGMAYRLSPGTAALVHYRPAGDFSFDGITYTLRRAEGVHTIRPILSLHADYEPGAGYRMRCDIPPTEYEIAHWMRTGHLPEDHWPCADSCPNDDHHPDESETTP